MADIDIEALNKRRARKADSDTSSIDDIIVNVIEGKLNNVELSPIKSNLEDNHVVDNINFKPSEEKVEFNDKENVVIQSPKRNEGVNRIDLSKSANVNTGAILNSNDFFKSGMNNQAQSAIINHETSTGFGGNKQGHSSGFGGNQGNTTGFGGNQGNSTGFGGNQGNSTGFGGNQGNSSGFGGNQGTSGFGGNQGSKFGGNSGGGFGGNSGGGFGGRNESNGFRGGDREGRGGFNREGRGGFQREGRGGGFPRDSRGGFQGERRGGFGGFNRDDRGGNTGPQYGESKFGGENIEQAKPKIETAEDKFDNDFKEIYDIIKHCLRNITNEKIRECLISSIQSNLTVFELINLLKKEEKCLQLLLPNSQVNFLIDNISIYESREEDIINSHKVIIDSYKIKPNKSKEESKENQFDDISDSRRKVTKDKYHYNYVPIKCKDHISSSDIEKNTLCKYSHTENEINYHPLTYKTLVCRVKECNVPYCSKAHGIDTNDLRLIYSYNINEFMKLANTIQKHSLGNQLASYSDFIKRPNEFNPSNYKVLKCELRECGKQDRRLCHNYHLLEERRRPPMLFKYLASKCSNFNQGICKNEDFCNYSHGNYESLYHQDNYNRFPCTKQEKTGSCPYKETCYGFHGKQSENKNAPDDMVILRENISQLNIKLSKFACKLCKKSPNNPIYAIFNCCKKIICESCVKQRFISNISIELDNSSIKCPLCNVNTQVKAYTVVDFNK